MTLWFGDITKNYKKKLKINYQIKLNLMIIIILTNKLMKKLLNKFKKKKKTPKIMRMYKQIKVLLNKKWNKIKIK